MEALAGQITRLDIAADGQLRLAERVPVGAGATYISIHPRGRYLLAAMPAPHCLSVHPLREDGRVEPVSALVQLHGRGVNTITLERPFPHSIRPDASGKRVLACDMGLDRVMVYDLDERTGRLEPSPHPFAQLSSGSGPRHLAIHANNQWVYTVNELDSSVSAFTYDADSAAMRIISTTSTRPEGFSGHNSGAQIVIHPSGRFLYSSNRGHNSIASFALDVDTGQPRLTGLVDSQGVTPRNFNVDPTGEFLIVANVGSSNIATFRIDPTTGQLSPTGHSVACPNPVCVMFR